MLKQKPGILKSGLPGRSTNLSGDFIVDGGEVTELEAACEQALRPFIDEHINDLSDRVVHLMAKAAVAVLEAALAEDE